MISAIFIYHEYFFTFNDIKGEFQDGPGPIISPTERYTANAYFQPYGGAAGGVNVWVEITDNNDGEKETIYYSDVNANFDLKWEDKDTLSIINEAPQYPDLNKSIKLDVEKEIYHDQGLACSSWLMQDEYETCYQE